MRKHLLLIVGAGLLLAGCTQNTTPAANETATTPEPTAEATQADPTQEKKIAGYTLEDVAKHSTKTDCWLAIDGKVYDVTKYIEANKHPGGEAIVFGCGKDASEMFHNRGEEKEDHSDKAKSFLPNFEIGTLTTEE